MKYYTKKELEAARPTVSVETAVGFCLRKLSEDDDNMIDDEIVNGLTFEEVIGALLLARDAIEEHEAMVEYYSEKF